MPPLLQSSSYVYCLMASPLYPIIYFQRMLFIKEIQPPCSQSWLHRGAVWSYWWTFMENTCLMSYSHENQYGSDSKPTAAFSSASASIAFSLSWRADSRLLCWSITGDGSFGRGLFFGEVSWLSARVILNWLYVSKIIFFLSISVMDYIYRSFYSLVN